jgi:serine/arginine repetitive matrix protein 2
MVPSHPGRNPSPTYYSSPHPDIPPIPPLHHHLVVEQARMLHRPAKGSVSSGSTNQRTDSDALSSDATSPPTPKDGLSMDRLNSLTGTHILMESLAGVMKKEVLSGPLYYDYSEQFERDEYIEPEAEPVPTGFVNRIKTILEERGTAEPTPKKVGVSVIREVVGLTGPNTIEIAELPASPVPRRITRDMILAALEPNSTDEGIATAGTSMEVDRSVDPEVERKEEQAENGHPGEEMCPSSIQSEEIKDKRFSILSQAGSSIMESSTLDFAVRYSIPMVAGNGAESATGAATRSESMAEDGMSDLLDGYQHTETKQDDRIVIEKETMADELAERKSNHTPKSSDEQSFKSCTDLPDQDSDAKSAKSVKTVKTAKDSVDSVKTSTDLPEQPFKDSDARSFKTCKDVVTPDRAVPMPPSSLPSSNLPNMEHKGKRPASEITLPSSPPTARKLPLVPPRESSFIKVHARLRANSNPSSRHGGSTTTSISSSVNSPAQGPPVVPPRESSNSKEAQRTQAVADFLLRLSRGRRFSKTQSTLSKNQSRGEGAPKSDENGNVSKWDSPSEYQGGVSGINSLNQPPDLVKTPEKALPKEQVLPEKYVPAGASTKHDASTKGSTPVTNEAFPTAPALHQYSLSTPSPVRAESSSVCSPENISSSSSLKVRVQSSPMAFARSHEHNRRDSTTHLVWHGRKTSNLQSGNPADSRVNQEHGQDGTTTDLRLSAYRYPLHYLPDLKEESHEDSSLNTSASNLKNSSFRFPYGGQPSVRMSGDDAFLFGRNPSRNPSTRSYQRSSLAQTRGLPSMNFSRMNLIEKLNEALDIRCSKSLDGRPVDVNELGGSYPVRPSSAGEIREKYRSFFASLDELGKTGGDASQRAAIVDLVPTKRRYSPVHLMAEIDKLSIPSVGGLTQRLSELIPSLKEYYKLGEVGEFIEEEVIMEHALEEIHEVGGPALKRSSARLRPMPGSPNMVVIDDALYDELTGREKEHASPDSSSAENKSPCKSCREEGKGKGIANAGARDQTVLAELEAPSPAILRTRSLSLSHHHLRPSLELKLSSRRSLHSLVISTPTVTTTDTRPWNSDRNYPWATTIPAVDISLPSPTFAITSPRRGPSRLRKRLSESSATNASSPYTNFTSASQLDAMSVPNNEANSHHGRVKGLFKSLYEGKQSNSLQPKGFDASGNAMGPLRLRETDQSHDVGERYPFSALTPPSNLHFSDIPENQSSDDESSYDGFGMPDDHKYRKTTRLEYMKRKWKNPTRTQDGQHDEEAQNGITVPLARSDTIHPQNGNHFSTPTDSVHDGTDDARVSNPRRQTYSGAEGMSTAKYHRKQLIAQIKKIWHKTLDEAAKLGRRLSNRKSTSDCQTPFPKNVEDKAYIDADGKRRVPLTGSRGVALYTGV